MSDLPSSSSAPVVVDYSVDILIQILARLPAKTLLKFRCVCKSWNSLIQQDHHFISLHHQLHLNDNKKQSPPLVTCRPAEGEGFNIILNYSSSDSTPYEFEFKDRPYFITNSCNGLLGVYSCNSFFIVNPAIRKLRPLPIIRSDNPFYGRPQAALGFDTSAGVYKVVRIYNREYDGLTAVGFGCEVCYLGSGSDGWKQIDDPPVVPYYDSLPVAVDGAIIWASDTRWGKDQEVVALSFDLREEKFSVILHPEVSSRPTMCPRSHVFASEGRICVADEIPPPVHIPYMHIQHLNIWLLVEEDDKKKNAHKWVKQYVVDLTHQFEHIGPFIMARPLATDHNGRIVISWGQGRKHYYDPRTESFVKHELDATNEEHAAPYIESMVWPNSDLAVDFDRFGFDSNIYCLGLFTLHV